MNIEEINKLDFELQEKSFFNEWMVSRRSISEFFFNREYSANIKNNFINTNRNIINKESYVLIINNPRYESLGEYDPWIKCAIKDFKKIGCSYSVVSNLDKSNSLRKNISYNSNIIKKIKIYFLIFIKIFKFFKLLKSFKKKSLTLNIDILKNIIGSHIRFLIQKDAFKNFTKDIEYDYLLMTDCTSNAGIVYSAKKSDKYVIEMQHGLITPNIPQYHFPNLSNNSYIPDEILLFSKYWMNASSFAKGTNLGTFNSLEFSILDWIQEKNTANRSFVLVGQKNHMDILIKDFKKIIRLYENKKDLNFFVKLHPRQKKTDFIEEFKQYPQVNIFTFSENIRINNAVFLCGNSSVIFQLITYGYTILINNFFVKQNNTVRTTIDFYLTYNDIAEFNDYNFDELFLKKDSSNYFYSDEYSQGQIKII